MFIIFADQKVIWDENSFRKGIFYLADKKKFNVWSPEVGERSKVNVKYVFKF